MISKAVSYTSRGSASYRQRSDRAAFRSRRAAFALLECLRARAGIVMQVWATVQGKGSGAASAHRMPHICHRALSNQRPSKAHLLVFLAALKVRAYSSGAKRGCFTDLRVPNARSGLLWPPEQRTRPRARVDRADASFRSEMEPPSPCGLDIAADGAFRVSPAAASGGGVALDDALVKHAQ